MNTQLWWKTGTALILAVTVGLSGCSSGGGGSHSQTSASDGSSGSGGSGGGSGGGDGSGGGTVSPFVTSRMVSGTGSTTDVVGGLVSTLGINLAALPIPGVTTLTDGVGGLVDSTGDAVSSLSSGLTTGLGQLGTDGNALGTTVAGAANAVGDVGTGVSRLGRGVRAFAVTSQVGGVPVVSPVVDQTGNLVDGVGQRVTMLGDTLSTAATTGPLGNLTQGVGDRLVPVIALAESTTGKVGSATGLGTPVGGLLNGVATTLDNTGEKVVEAGGHVPLASTIGGLLVNGGNVVGTASGYLGNGDSGSGGLPGLGDSGLLETVGGVVAGAGNGLAAGSSSGVLDSLGLTGLSLGNSVASLGTVFGGDGVTNSRAGVPVARLGSNLGNALNPVTSGVTSLTQNIGNGTGLGAPVNGLLGQVGTTVSGVGTRLGNASGSPVIGNLGQTVNAVGVSVGSVGGLVNGGTGTAAGSPGLGGLGGLLNGLTSRQ